MEHSNVVDAQLNTLGSNSAQGTSSSPIDRILNSRALSHLYEFGVLSDVKILDDEAGECIGYTSVVTNILTEHAPGPDEFDHGSRFGAWGVGLYVDSLRSVYTRQHTDCTFLHLASSQTTTTSL